MKIQIVGLNKADVLLALYNNALFRGEGSKDQPMVSRLAQMSGDGDRGKADEQINEAFKSGNFYFDYIDLGAGPRPLKVDLKGFEFESSLYDRDHGENLAEKVIFQLRNATLSATKKAFKDSVADGNANPFAEILHLINQKMRESNQPVFLYSFNPKNTDDLKKLNELLQEEVGIKDKENEALNEKFTNMVEWLKKYVNSPEFIKLYPEERALELIAEATFWSVNLGLAPLIEKMSYAEVRTFAPLQEMHKLNGRTERSDLIEKVADKMTKPAWSHEASYALQEAAWAIYVHKNSYKVMKEQEAIYESSKAAAQEKCPEGLSKRSIVNLQELINLLKLCKTKSDGDFLPQPELALRRASAAGKMDIVKGILRNVKDIDINQPGPDSGKTAYSFAVEKNNFEIAELLKEKGAIDPNAGAKKVSQRFA